MPRRFTVFAITLLVAAAAARAVTGGENMLLFGGSHEVHLPPTEVPAAHTIELWLKPRPGVEGRRRALVLGGVAAIDVNPPVVDYRLDIGGAQPARVSASGIAAGEWRHVAASFDGRRMRLYIDGLLVNVRIAIGKPASGAGGRSAIGGSGDPAEPGFVGAIDEVRWWGRCRGSEEILADRLRKLSGLEGGLAGAYPFDEGSGPVVRDISPAGGLGILGVSRLPDRRDPAWSESDSPVRAPDAGWFLSFDPPGPLALRSGEEFALRCILRCPSGSGDPIRSWSLSVRHDPSHLAIVGAGATGTGLDAHLEGGGAIFETIDEPGAAGLVVGAVIADGAPPLPAAGDVALAEIRYRALSAGGAEEVASGIRFEEGLPGSGGPVRNSIHVGSRRILPAEGELSATIRPPVVDLGFSGEHGLAAAPGAEFAVECLLRVAENRGMGPQSWSISVQHDPAVLEIVDATTDGTVVETAVAETSVFQITELVDNETGTGFLSAIILGMEKPYNLPANGESRIARARYRVRPDAPIGGATEISYRDGLQQSGVAIDNVVVFISGTDLPRKGSIEVRVARSPFIRGDFNGDGRMNIADAVKLLTWLFIEHFEAPCLDAGDVNDDGRVDLSDPMRVLSSLFLDPRWPPPPYPGAGSDPTPDALDCERSNP